ncbi:uncharacterized protein [Argopecten irradians]|uniref:uncharacterized protein n=1 Tax=Argopecten irradians TaxID=31199 RepID=UPI00371CD64F
MRHGLIGHSGKTAIHSSSDSDDDPETEYVNNRVKNENKFGYKDELSLDTRRTKIHRPTEKKKKLEHHNNIEDISYVRRPRIDLPEKPVFTTIVSIKKVSTPEPPFSDEVTKTTPAHPRRLQKVVTAIPTDRDSTVPSDWPSGRRFNLPITSEGIRYVGGIMSSLLRRIQKT